MSAGAAAPNGIKMIKTLILTHGALGYELLAAARHISGEMPEFEALCLAWEDSFDVAHGKVADHFAKLAPETEVLILTDIFGGTPYNVAVTFYDPGRVEVVTGVNLPMVVRLGCALERRRRTPGELAIWIQAKGKRAICTAGEAQGCMPPPTVVTQSAGGQ